MRLQYDYSLIQLFHSGCWQCNHTSRNGTFHTLLQHQHCFICIQLKILYRTVRNMNYIWWFQYRSFIQFEIWTCWTFIEWSYYILKLWHRHSNELYINLQRAHVAQASWGWQTRWEALDLIKQVTFLDTLEKRLCNNPCLKQGKYIDTTDWTIQKCWVIIKSLTLILRQTLRSCKYISSAMSKKKSFTSLFISQGLCLHKISLFQS